jgi:ribosomal protein S11
MGAGKEFYIPNSLFLNLEFGDVGTSMFSRQACLRIPALTSCGSCCGARRKYITTRPPGQLTPSNESTVSNEEPRVVVPPAGQKAPSSTTFPSSSSVDANSPLLDIVSVYTDKHSPQRTGYISAFQPTTERSFYPQHESIHVPAIQEFQPTPKSSAAPAIDSKVGYAIYVNNSTRNTHVTITNHNRDPIVVVSAGILGLKNSKRGTQEAGAATLKEALKRFAEKYPVDKKDVFIELVFKGFGPGRKGAMTTIMGPHGDLIRPKINRITDATALAIGRTKVKNPKRR